MLDKFIQLGNSIGWENVIGGAKWVSDKTGLTDAVNSMFESEDSNQSNSQPQQLTEADILIATKIIEITMKTLWAEESQVLPEASFTDLGADDLDHVTLIMAFEKEFGLSIPDENAEKIITVGDAFNYIRSKKC